MNKKAQMITIFFSLFLILAIITIISIESANLQTNQNINSLQQAYNLPKQEYYNFLNVMAQISAINPSSATNAVFNSTIENVYDTFLQNFNISQKGLNTSSLILLNPNNFNRYVVLNIKNGQSVATASPFQQLVEVNMSQYRSFAGAGLQNVEFYYQNGTVIPSWLESGNFNLAGASSANFSGSGYIEQSNGFNWMNNPSQQFTISIWVNPSEPNGVIVDELGQSTIDTAWHDSWISLENGNVYIRVWSLGCTSIGSINLNQWSNIILTYNGTAFYGYINGNLTGHVSGTRSTPGGSSSMYYPLGVEDSTNCGGNSGSYFTGNMSNYQFYNSSLSQSQIKSLYYAGPGGEPVAYNSLAMWWPLIGNSNAYFGNNKGIDNNVAFVALPDSIYWLKVNSIPAGSSVKAYMGFAPESINLFNKLYTGEAPQLSTVYGQYDDGANVFTAYSNFAGTSLPSGFTSYLGDATISVNNGLFIQVTNNGCTSTWAGIVYNNPINAVDSVVETYSSGTRVAGPEDVGLYTGNSDTAGGYAGVADTWGWGYGSISGGYSNIGNPFNIGLGSGIASIYWIGSGNEGIGWNYDFVSSSNANQGWSSSLYASIQDGECSPGANMEYYWFRVRSYPPNGVMPSITFSV